VARSSRSALARSGRAAAIALVAAALLSGCGGGGADGLPEAPEVEVPAELEPAVEQAGAVVDFCDAARANGEAATALDEFLAAGEPPRPEDELSDLVEPLQESNEQMAQSAPEPAKADAEQLVTLSERRLEILTESGGDVAAISADQAYVEQAQGAQEAAGRFRAFVRTTCGVDLG
jgi:hypothetical protein